MVAIRGLATCLPSHSIEQVTASAYAAQMPVLPEKQKAALQRLYRLTRIKTRSSVLADDSIDCKTFASFFPIGVDTADLGPSTADRMKAYNNFAALLSTQACRESLLFANCPASSITHLVTVSCTGFGAPGFDLNLVTELGLSPRVFRTHVGFMGCHGTMNALRVAQGLLAQNPSARVLLCATEICSLHFQYGRNTQDIVANSLFADGAASMVLCNTDSDASQLEYVDSYSYVVPHSQDAMSWTIGDNGFKMTLSPQVPALIEKNLADLLSEWLAAHGLSIADIASWAVHPGGPKILDAVANSLALRLDELKHSRQILEECGNMSSPTVMFIVQRILQTRTEPERSTPLVALAFGPGLTVEAALFT